MIFAHCNLIQEEEAVLFYKYIRILPGYMITGLIIAPNFKAKLAFTKVWKYFASEVVTSDDVYCSIIPSDNTIPFKINLTYHSELGGLSIYKVDKAAIDQYSTYARHQENKGSG